MDTEHRLFGPELRWRRIEAGYSLAGLGRLVHYSRGHLSKVETGAKPPSMDLARRCDALLCGDGVLVRLAARRQADKPARAPLGADQVWVLELGARGARRLLMTTRRELLASGVLAPTGVVGLRSSCGNSRTSIPAHRGVHTLPAGDASAVETFRLWFQQVRDMGQRMGPDLLIPILVAHTESLTHLAQRSQGEDRTRTLLLAARYAEYSGWMAQEAGSNRDAAWWTDRAVEYATAGGDLGMSAYALVRRALIALYQRDAARTVALAQAAQRAGGRPRIRGLAAQREGQGLALAGDRGACLAAFDRARELLAADPVRDDDLVIGSSHVSDPVSAATGWSLFDLGRPLDAAEVLRGVLLGIPPQAMRARARYGARLALALASCRQLDEACAVTGRVLELYARVQSATIGADLRAVSRSLRRWHAEPAVRQMSLQLTAALQSTPARVDYLA